jgi:hypothetical protein
MAQTRDSREALLELGLLEGDEEGCAETLGDADSFGFQQTRNGKLLHTRRYRKPVVRLIRQDLQNSLSGQSDSLPKQGGWSI